ncbi:hypothetical protein [Streptomyces macrosporus]|uniref:Uncharacterized protein n=1 Tax=Streptomyces macrosporus TaxID=44032 RepID=A0ABP5WV18_9ACTN
MSGWTPSQAEGERDDDEGVDQSRGLSERHSAQEAEKARKAGRTSAPSQAEGDRTDAQGTEQDRGKD